MKMLCEAGKCQQTQFGLFLVRHLNYLLLLYKEKVFNVGVSGSLCQPQKRQDLLFSINSGKKCNDL